jgi:hypothetical protein
MTKREPELELLLQGGDLIKLTQLDHAAQRDAMRAALREWIPQLTRRDAAEPAHALIDALAACLDVMGFYHDRILTESKLGAAQRIESVARLGAAIGFRPLPAIAATAMQFFFAAKEGTVAAGTRVGGADAVFATRRALEISPKVNRMDLSPVITLHTGGRRAVIERLDTAAARQILAALEAAAEGRDAAAEKALAVLDQIAADQQGSPASLPSDEFGRGTMAMLSSDHGLELCAIAASRARGVAFERALLRSYDEGTTITRTTRVRHLRHGQMLDDSLIAFEVSELPILHVPDPAKPEIMTPALSTLEIFVFDDQPAADPEDWDRTAAWTEVFDFSASKAADLHYRTFVDDRLTTYIVLRRKLGYRTLLDDQQLNWVYARYTPAVGRVIEPPSPPSGDLWKLDGITLRLCANYLTTSLVRPKLDVVANLHNQAQWAVTKDDMGLPAGAQIAVLGGASGATYVRTLHLVSERYVRWGNPPVVFPLGERPAGEFDPIDDTFDPEKAKIAPLADVAAGQLYPLWEAYYKQAEAPSQVWIKPARPLRRARAGLAAPERLTDIPPYPYSIQAIESELADVKQQLYLHKGSTFLLLADASHVKAGDYLLVGRRLKKGFQNPNPAKAKTTAGGPGATSTGAQPEAGDGNGPDDKEFFQSTKPWLTAEVVQALEVQGDLVRLKDPIAQDYYIDGLPSRPDPITEIVVVPRVSSVYYGDLFFQSIALTGERTFVKVDSSPTASYIAVALDPGIDPVALRRQLELSDSLDLSEKLSRLFLAVDGKLGEPPTTPAPVAWSFVLTLPARGLSPDHLVAVQIQSTVLPIDERPLMNATGGLEIPVALVDDAIAAKNHPDEILLLARQDEPTLAWTEQGQPDTVLTRGQFRAASLAGWHLRPPDLASHGNVLAAGGALLLWAGVPQPAAFSFAWEPEPATVRLDGVDPTAPRPVGNVQLDAVAIPGAHSVAVTVPDWTADWRLPAGLFHNTTSWMSAAGGILGLRYASSFHWLAFTMVDLDSARQIELLDAAIQDPLDPLDGATQLWAVPDHDAVKITAGQVTAVWRFPVKDDIEAAAPGGWTGPLVVVGAGQILRSATLEGPPSNHALVARLDGDVTHDLQSSGDVHALLADAAQTFAPMTIWQWTDKSPFPGLSSGTAALTFKHDVSVVLVDLRQQGTTLWLIPGGAMTSETVVSVMVRYHATAVHVQSRALDGADTRITFTLPPDWPSATPVTGVHRVVAQNAAHSAQILDLVDPPGEVAGSAGVFTAKVTGDVTDDQLAIHLALGGPLSGSVSTRHALHAVQPAWDSWVAGHEPALFFMPAPIGSDAVSSIPAGAERVSVTGTGFSDGFWFVRTGADAPFPAAGALYLSPYTASGVTPRPATVVKLGTLPDQSARIGFVGISNTPDHWDAYKLDAGQLTAQGDVELPGTAAAVFPGGITGTILARFAYEVVTYGGDRGSIGLALHTASAGILASAHGANTVVFHTAEFQQAARGDVSISPLKDRVNVAIDPDVVFSRAGHPSLSLVSLGVGWKDLAADSLAQGSLVLELGPPAQSPLPLGVGDELTLVDEHGGTSTATILQVTAPGTYQLASQDAPAKVRLRALRAPLAPPAPPALLANPRVTVSFPKPATLHEPWLLTFHGPGDALDSGGIAGTLLFHQGAQLGTDDRLSFTLVGNDMLDAIQAKKALRYYTNEVSQLQPDLYDGSLVGLSGANNFLETTVSDPVKALLAAVTAASFPVANGTGPRVLLCATSRTRPLAKDDGYIESGTGDRVLAGTVPVLSKSIVFPSGDFIPVTGTLQDRDDKIIRNALRVWLLDKGKESRPVTYEPRLSRIVELLDAGKGWPDIAKEFPPPQPPIEGLANSPPSLLLYNFNKALGGTFTLDFLLADAALADNPDVRVYVEYTAHRLDDDAATQDLNGRIYQFETPLLRLDPTTQLVVIDKGELKPDDYLFLHTAQQPIIQWTRVQSVTGVVIQVDPPLPFLIDRFRDYVLRGFAKPARPAVLDKDYYAQVKGADFNASDRSKPIPLVLADRLVLDPEAGKDLLAAIIPGDHLLIWDESRRVAWHDHRVQGGDDAGWNDWPDYQHEAVVKQVDAATGLVVLTEPLPDRFQVAFTLVDHPDQAAPGGSWLTLEPSALTLRALPHYRAPFQGERSMITLGSGDRSRKFARFTGEIAADPELGLGTIPLSGNAVYASNIEILARDPRSGDWSRWTQFDDIKHAEKKDLAFTLGVDPSRIGTAQPVPFSASFGDGDRNGQLLPTGNANVFARVTAIGSRVRQLAGRRPLLILAAQADRQVPFTVPPAANAASKNLWLLVETGGPEAWSPAGGLAPWRPTLEIEAPQNQVLRSWIERTKQEVLDGWDGFYVQSVRPGVVEVFFFTPDPLELDLGRTSAWEVPDAQQWILDAAFYADLEAQDLTRRPGALQLQLLDTDSLATGSLLALAQGTTGPLEQRKAGLTEIVTLASVDPETWSARLTQPLVRRYAIDQAFLCGNVVEVVQGDTERVVLGSGDGASLGMQLAVSTRKPLLHVQRDGATDPEPAIDVLVDDVPWTRVLDLAGAGPRDRVYRVDLDADGRVFVQFGDGLHGAVPGPGTSNIVARARTGNGQAGNVAVDTLTKLVDGNLAVKSTSNLTEGAGGRDRDTADLAREALLRRSLGLDRIVSLEDVSQIARNVGEVLHARVDSTAPAGQLRLVVALEGRRPLTDTVRDTVTAQVTDLLPATAGVRLTVDGATPVPVHLVVQITTGEGYGQGEVLAALRRAFGTTDGGFFAEERCPIAEPLRLGDVYEAVFAVPGVASAFVAWMSSDKPPSRPGGPVPDALDPGPDGVLRCDNDPVGDPDGHNGTITFSPTSGGAS